MKETKVTVDTTKKNFRSDALAIAGIDWRDAQYFKIDGNTVSIFTLEKDSTIVCQFCGCHTTDRELVRHIAIAHPREI